MLERWFLLRERGGTVRGEVRGGLTTFMVMALTGFRAGIMNAIPMALKRAIGVGIGLFILLIGLASAGIVKPGPPGVPVTLGDLTTAPVAVALFGLFLTLWLQARRVSAAFLIGILATTALAVVVNASTGGRAYDVRRGGGLRPLFRLPLLPR